MWNYTLSLIYIWYQLSLNLHISSQSLHLSLHNLLHWATFHFEPHHSNHWVAAQHKHCFTTGNIPQVPCMFYTWSIQGPLCAAGTMMIELEDHLYVHSQQDRIHRCYSPVTLANHNMHNQATAYSENESYLRPKKCHIKVQSKLISCSSSSVQQGKGGVLSFGHVWKLRAI